MKTPEEIKKGLETCIGKCTGNKPHCPYHTHGDGCMDSMNRDARAYIQQLESQVPKWISVEERLPEVSVRLAYEYSAELLAYDGEHMYDAYYCHTTKMWHDACDEDHIIDVTHWMPMPEPPKEE